jgi:hypothetical protein
MITSLILIIVYRLSIGILANIVRARAGMDHPPFMTFFILQRDLRLFVLKLLLFPSLATARIADLKPSVRKKARPSFMPTGKMNIFSWYHD